MPPPRLPTAENAGDLELDDIELYEDEDEEMGSADEDEDESQAAKKEYVLTFNFVQPIDTQSLIRLVQGNHCMPPIAHYSSATSMATPSSASTTSCQSSPL